MMTRTFPVAALILAVAAPAAFAQSAPASAPAATPATTPAAATTSPVFVIPFRRGATNVDNDAEDVLDRVIAYAQRNRSMHLMISGMSNAAGSDANRMTRGMAMARSVQDYLQESGIGGARLHVEATGAMPNAGAVPAGVSDPAAARVEIRFMPGR